VKNRNKSQVFSLNEKTKKYYYKSSHGGINVRMYVNINSSLKSLYASKFHSSHVLVFVRLK